MFWVECSQEPRQFDVLLLSFFILKVKAIKVLNVQFFFFFAFIRAWCTGKTQRDRVEMWEGGLEWGTHVNPWLIHVNVWKKKNTIL